MADRVSHAHPSVTTLRATLGRRGGTRDRELRLPGDTDPPGRDVIRLVIAGTEYHAPFERAMDDTPVLRGAFESPDSPGSAPARIT